MKSIFTVSIVLMSFICTESFAQKSQTLHLQVSGVCDMCKDRIEKAVDVNGVRFANYDVDKQELEISFKTSKISEDEIHQLIADIGHDTGKVKASDEAYNNLHGCCKYRDGAKCEGEADPQH
jgi:copper chaperone CopZ